MAGRTVRDYVQSRADGQDGPVLAAIDQVEELAADSGPRLSYRRLFLAELAEAMEEEPRLHLLLAVRSEAVDIVADVLGPGARHLVTPLSRQDAIEAVVGPTRDTSRSYDEGVAEAIVTDLQTSRIAPLGGGEHCITGDDVQPAILQVVCAHLWDSLPAGLDLITRRELRRYGDAITRRELRRYGDADAALASHCGQIVAAVAEDHDLPVTRLRAWLQSTFITELGTREPPTRARPSRPACLMRSHGRSRTGISSPLSGDQARGGTSCSVTASSSPSGRPLTSIRRRLSPRNT